MNYKQPDSVNDVLIAFHVLLELGTSDPASAAEAFRVEWMNAANRSHDGTRDVFQEIVSQDLIPMGLVSIKENERLQVTPRGLVWGQVFHACADGTFIVFGGTIDELAWPTFHAALDAFAEELADLQAQLALHLDQEHTTPARLDNLIRATATLQQLPGFPVRFFGLETYREAVVLACRGELLRLRKSLEDLEVRARDRQVLDGTKRKLEHIEEILAIPDLSSARTAPKPRVTDFVNVGIIEASHGRPTDEKFGILAAPSLFTTDFAEIAEGAFSRGRSFAVGFIDIDDFKDFNSKHLETVVDKNMLPPFMRALEAYCYGRAFAYRQGGDEYLVLIRNADKKDAKTFFEGLQAHLAEIKYPEVIANNPRVSIGIHVIDGDHEVTVFEAKKLANEAKDTAKKAGRNCIRFSSDSAA